MIVPPPSSAGADHDTTADVLPRAALALVGTPGVLQVETALDAPDAEPVPAAFVAVTVNVYEVASLSPVTVHERGPVVHVQVAPPGEAATV